MRNLWRENAAQLSMELILVLAAVLAVALLAISSLTETAKSGEKVGGRTAKKILRKLR